MASGLEPPQQPPAAPLWTEATRVMDVHVRGEKLMRHGPTPLDMAETGWQVVPMVLMVPMATPSHCTVQPPWHTVDEPVYVVIATFDTHVADGAEQVMYCPMAWKLTPSPPQLYESVAQGFVFQQPEVVDAAFVSKARREPEGTHAVK
jgi:hypothetical protein